METRTKEKVMMICPKHETCEIWLVCSHKKPHEKDSCCDLETENGCPACAPVESPKSKSKGIRILGRKVIRGGVDGRIIDSFENLLSWEELPVEYSYTTNGFPVCYEFEGFIKVWESFGTYYELKVGKFIPEEAYLKYRKLMNQAGENLAKINKELREKKEVPFEDVI